MTLLFFYQERRGDANVHSVVSCHFLYGRKDCSGLNSSLTKSTRQPIERTIIGAREGEIAEMIRSAIKIADVTQYFHLRELPLCRHHFFLFFLLPASYFQSCDFEQLHVVLICGTMLVGFHSGRKVGRERERENERDEMKGKLLLRVYLLTGSFFPFFFIIMKKEGNLRINEIRPPGTFLDATEKTYIEHFSSVQGKTRGKLVACFSLCFSLFLSDVQWSIRRSRR